MKVECLANSLLSSVKNTKLGMDSKRHVPGSGTGIRDKASAIVLVFPERNGIE